MNKDGSKIYCKDKWAKTVYTHRQEEGKWMQTKQEIDTEEWFSKLAVNPQTDEVALGTQPNPQILILRELPSNTTNKEMILEFYDISKLKYKDHKVISESIENIYQFSLKIGHDLFETFINNHKEIIVEVAKNG